MMLFVVIILFLVIIYITQELEILLKEIKTMELFMQTNIYK